MAEDGEAKWLKTVRVSLGIINLFFIIAGAALLGLGIWIFLDIDEYENVCSKGSPYGPAIIAISTGVLVVVFSFMGAVGAFAKSRRILITYIALMLLILFLQIIVVALSFQFKDKVKENTSEDLQEAVTKYGGSSNVGLIDHMDKIHKDFKCCGYDSAVNWINSSWYKTKNIRSNSATDKYWFPISCCKDLSLRNCSAAKTNSFTLSCTEELSSWSRGKLIILASVSIALLCLQIFGILIGTVLLRMTPKNDFKSER